MFDEISDTRIQAMLKRHLSANHMQNPKLKNLRLCGTNVTRQMGALPAAFVVTNGTSSRFFGVNTCHSIWACPRCTAKAMADKGREIACAIDALQQNYNEVAFMVTLTLPHVKGMTCAETFNIIAETWRSFSKTNKRQIRRSYERKDGSTATYKILATPYNAFYDRLDIKHSIRVYEFTYGKNSWHPHIHALLWVPRDKLSEVVKYEDKLNEYWWKCAKRNAVKVLKKSRPNQDAEAFVDKLYADWKLQTKTGHKAFFISKDKHGNARIQHSSQYISGWSGNYELTSEKTARGKGHMTPFQMLERAYRTKDDAERQKLMALFTEYAETVHKRARTFWSIHSGIKDIIRQWQQSEGYVETLKKKFTDKATEVGRWKVACWFSVEQWSSICCLELSTLPNIKAKILTLARLPDAEQKIAEFLIEHDIDIRNNGKHHLTDHIENKVLMANVLTADAA